MSEIDVGKRDLMIRKNVKRAFIREKGEPCGELINMQYVEKKVIRGRCTDSKSGIPYNFECEPDGTLVEIEFADND